MQGIREKFITLGYSSDASHLLMSSWREPTQKAYNTYVAKWNQYASQHQIAVSAPKLPHVINFLTDLFKNGASYSAINTTRSALSAILPSALSAILPHTPSGPVGAHPDVCRLLKGVFEQRPALPKIRGHMGPRPSTVPSIQDLSAKELTLRTATLLSLLTGQRGHALHSLKLNDIRFTKDESKCKIFSEKHKTSKPGAHTEPSEILAYVENPKLCLVKHLKAYIEKTQEHRKSADSKLFLCYTKPFGPVSRNTFSRWVKSVLAKAGIDTGKYTGHSTRAASCSAVAERASLHTVLKAAGWKSESTFAKFYKKDVLAQNQNFGQVLLDRFLEKQCLSEQV